MLLATILVDTYNLDLHSGRTTEQDIFIAEILSSYINDVDTDALFTMLQKGLSDDLIRYDHRTIKRDSFNSSRQGVHNTHDTWHGHSQNFF